VDARSAPTRPSVSMPSGASSRAAVGVSRPRLRSSTHFSVICFGGTLDRDAQARTSATRFRRRCAPPHGEGRAGPGQTPSRETRRFVRPSASGLTRCPSRQRPPGRRTRTKLERSRRATRLRRRPAAGETSSVPKRHVPQPTVPRRRKLAASTPGTSSSTVSEFGFVFPKHRETRESTKSPVDGRASKPARGSTTSECEQVDPLRGYLPNKRGRARSAVTVVPPGSRPDPLKARPSCPSKRPARDPRHRPEGVQAPIGHDAFARAASACRGSQD